MGDIEYNRRLGKSPWTIARLDMVQPLNVQRQNEKTRSATKKKMNKKTGNPHSAQVREEGNRAFYNALIGWAEGYGALGTHGGEHQKNLRTAWAKIVRDVSNQAEEQQLRENFSTDLPRNEYRAKKYWKLSRIALVPECGLSERKGPTIKVS